MKTTRRLIFAAIPAFALAAIDVFADSYPDRRIAMVIPFPAGGPTDAIARPLAQALSASLGQPVIVENRSAAPAAPWECATWRVPPRTATR